MLAALRRSMQQVCGAHLRVIASRQRSFFQRNVAAVASPCNIMSDLTGPRFEHQTSRSKNKYVSARTAGRLQRTIDLQHLLDYTKSV